jgi:hypothetical protein
MKRPPLAAVVPFCFVLSFASPAFDSVARAEFVRIEPIAQQAASQLALLIGDKPTVVAARYVNRTPPLWPYHEALATELTIALRKGGVDAVRACSHPATEALSQKNSSFVVADARLAKEAGCDVLLAVEIALFRNKPRAKFTLWPTQGSKKLGDASIDLPAESFDLAGNAPPLNQKVLQFCKENYNRRVGDGDSPDLASEALEAAGAERLGVYLWGRELDPQEPYLPGDILQMENVRIDAGNQRWTMDHHTVVIEEVRPDALVVLHQNVRPVGQIVHRATFPLASDIIGIVRGYRPWSGESPLPPVSPRRRGEAKVVRQGKTIDLLATLDPKLDSVRGIWWLNGKSLQMNGETYARVQVPVTPPENYTLRMKATRLAGDDMLGIGVVIGGKQALVAVDGYEGTKTGLSQIDGRTNEDNETTFSGALLRESVPVELVVQVRAGSAKLTADGRTIFEWKGDPARLSLQDDYAVPNQARLVVATWNTIFEISEFTLTEEAGAAQVEAAPSLRPSPQPPASQPSPPEIDPFNLR